MQLAAYTDKDESVARLFSVLNKYQLSYAYNGNFTDDLTGRILSLAENNMEAESESSKTRKKVYFIMVESLQNITRHQGSPDQRLLDGFFSIHKFENGYLVTSGNIVENKHIDNLKQKLEKVNSMDQDRLKEYSQEVLKSGGFSEKGGAGLGLIEMVRKSGNKLEFDFKKLDDTYSYFYFLANTAANDPEEPASGSEKNNMALDVAKASHEAVIANNLNIFFHGRFQHENLKSLLSMAEGTVSVADNINFKKAVVSVMSELLQNICYHAATNSETKTNEKPGIFMVSNHEGVCTLTTGNYIEKNKVSAFLKLVDEVNAMDKETLNKQFLKTILDESKEEVHGEGLGLIEIRFRTKNLIEATLLPCSDTLDFLIIRAKLNY